MDGGGASCNALMTHVKKKVHLLQQHKQMAQLECLCTDTMRATCELDESNGMATLTLVLLMFFEVMEVYDLYKHHGHIREYYDEIWANLVDWLMFIFLFGYIIIWSVVVPVRMGYALLAASWPADAPGTSMHGA